MQCKKRLHLLFLVCKNSWVAFLNEPAHVSCFHWSAPWTAIRNSDSKGDRFIAVSHLKIGAGLHQLTDFGVEFLFFLLQTQHPVHPFHWKKGYSAGFGNFKEKQTFIQRLSGFLVLLIHELKHQHVGLAKDFSYQCTCSIALRTWRFCASFGFHLYKPSIAWEQYYGCWTTLGEERPWRISMAKSLQ